MGSFTYVKRGALVTKLVETRDEPDDPTGAGGRPEIHHKYKIPDRGLCFQRTSALEFLVIQNARHFLVITCIQMLLQQVLSGIFLLVVSNMDRCPITYTTSYTRKAMSVQTRH